MGLMHRFMYKFSIFVASVAGALSLMQGASLVTSVFRGGVVFLGTLLFFIVALYLMRWAIVATTVVEVLDGGGEEEEESAPAPKNRMKGQLEPPQVVTSGMLADKVNS